MAEVVSGVGAKAKRTDLGNVAKIQRSARIENATGGSYNERGNLRQIAGAAPTPTTGSAVSANESPVMPKVQTEDVFAPATGPLTNGAGFNTPGTPPNTITPALTSDDPARALAAAMFIANPNPYTQALLDSFNDEVVY